MMKEPLVSVIIPTYNREKLLPKAISSVINQTYRNWELIIVDDRSIDHTQKLIEEFVGQDKRIKYIKNTHKKGPGGARNQGIEIAKGKYIAFLDSDDEWFEHHLKDSINVLENEGVDVCVSLWYYKKDGKLIKTDYLLDKLDDYLNPYKKRNLYFLNGQPLHEYMILKGCNWCHTDTIVLKKDVLNKIGMFNEDLIVTQDTEFEFRLALNSKICLINDYHSIFNEGETNLHNFKNADNINDSLIVKKIMFHRKDTLKCYSIYKSIIRNSGKFRSIKKFNSKVNEYIAFSYRRMSYANHKLHKLKALYYFLLSFYYDFNIKRAVSDFKIEK